MEMKLPQVMRNINEFNIPTGDLHSYEIIYSGVNLIMMVDYKLSFNIEVKNSDKEIDVLIISRKDVTVWKNNDGYSEVRCIIITKGLGFMILLARGK
jgi:myo-inositol-hexaphosphate 3-phosphohydrolase